MSKQQSGPMSPPPIPDQPRQRKNAVVTPTNNNTQSQAQKDRRGPTTTQQPAQKKPTTRNEREGKKDDDKDDPKFIGPWKIGRTIGRGSSGRVKIAKHTQTGQYAAVKIVPRQLLLNSRISLAEAGAKADKAMLGIEREIVIMKLIEHPNILRLYDVWETGSELYLIMEYVEGGELFDHLVARGRLQEDDALHYFQQLISGVDYCHRFNICHRDLKPENLLLDKQLNIKIADFGMAALERENKLLETSCGSPHYASPEIVSGTHYHGSSSDIWSCGIILFALLVGRLPFDDENIRTLLSKVKIGKFNMPHELPELAKDLIWKMLEVDPKKRITMEGIRGHPWFTRKAPRPVPKFSEPPTPQEIERPVTRADEVDPDILANLRVLWYNPPEQTVLDALVSREKNWEKVFYFLLTKYRARNLENFNEEEVEGPKSSRMEAKGSSSRSGQSSDSKASTTSKPVTKRARVSTVPEEVVSPKSIIRPTSPPPAPVIKPIVISRPSSPQKSGRPLPLPPPTIRLQEATPERSSVIREREVQIFESEPPSPIIPIQIPNVGDPEMQRFFHDIVDQLTNMSVKTASVGSASPSLFGGSTPPTSIDTPMFGSAGDRFEDAECDVSDVDMEHIAEPAPIPIRPTVPHRTSTRTTTSTTTSRQSSGSSVVGSRGGRGTPLMRGSTISTPAPKLPTKPAPAQVRYSVDDKENYAKQARNSIQGPPRSILSPTKNGGHERRQTLGLAIQGGEMPNFESGDRSSQLRKRKVPDTTNSPILDPLSPRQSWFANLFNWKQLNCTLLSADNLAVTRSECKRLLSSFGVLAVLENADGQGVLRCRVEEILDTANNSSVLKPVKFRVEFTSHGTVSPVLNGEGTMKVTAVNMIMEKGAHSTFRAIYGRLKKEWECEGGKEERNRYSPRQRMEEMLL